MSPQPNEGWDKHKLNIRHAPHTCCPEMDIRICKGCGHDHGREWLIQHNKDLLSSQTREIVEKLEGMKMGTHYVFATRLDDYRCNFCGEKRLANKCEQSPYDLALSDAIEAVRGEI